MSGSEIPPGVVATSRDSLAIARVAARKDRVAALVRKVHERFGLDLPDGPSHVQSGELAFIGVGVETWLAVLDTGLADTDLNGFAASLRDVIDESATVADQMGSYVVLRLAGPHVREALGKFVALDLHSRAFNPGSAASTIAAHIPLTLWRLDDGPDELPVFELAVPRSYAGSFLHVLTESAAEFGFARFG
jgi:heterotetrameric sarcosine oxidase gamma subunit